LVLRHATSLAIFPELAAYGFARGDATTPRRHESREKKELVSGAAPTPFSRGVVAFLYP